MSSKLNYYPHPDPLPTRERGERKKFVYLILPLRGRGKEEGILLGVEVGIRDTFPSNILNYRKV